MKKPLFNIYVDVETTGFDPIRNDVILLAALVSPADKFEIIDKTLIKFKPDLSPVAWGTDAEKIHKISLNEASAFPERRASCIEFLHWVKPYYQNQTQMFVAHAAKRKFYAYESIFDYAFLWWAFWKSDLQYSLMKVLKPYRYYSTLLECRKIRKKNNTLSEWAKDISYPLKHHDPVSDVECCFYLHRFLETGLKYDN